MSKALERLAVEGAGIAVLAHAALMAKGMDRAIAEVRLKRQIETVERMKREVGK